MEKDETETPAKKLKLKDSLDPLQILHSDVFELIFQHLKNDDVLESSVVSPLWFEVTEGSAKCVEKLHLRIVVPFSKHIDEKFNTISMDLISQRNYQNIYLHNFRTIVPEVLKILLDRTWKKVYISARNLRNSRDFQNIMKIIEPSVENLSISLTYLENPKLESEELNLTFPNLKDLELNRSYGLLMREISENCRTLRVLNIDQDAVTWSNFQVYLRKILANNNQLERVFLWRCSTKLAFPIESIGSYHFKLKTFIYKNSEQPTDEEENCLHDFLESQAASLEKLRLEDWFGINVFKLIFKMPELEDLIIDLYDIENTIDWENLDLNSSSSIRKFHLDSYQRNRTKIKVFNALFGAMPNLRFLTTDFLDNESIKSIGLRCQMMEELEIQKLKASQVDDPLYFPHLKRFQCEDRIKMKMKRRINHKPMAHRTTFEQLVLTAVPYFVT